MLQATIASQSTPDAEDEFHGMSGAEFLQLTIEANKDPAETIQDLPLSERQKVLDNDVSKVLNVLDVECRLSKSSGCACVMSRESERITVVELHKTGMRTADIVRTTGFKQRTVYKIVRRYKETGGTSDRPRSGRPTTATTPENINKVRCRIRRNPEVSMNKMATDLGISRERVQHIARRKLGLRSYKVARIHFLNDAMKAERTGLNLKIHLKQRGARPKQVGWIRCIWTRRQLAFKRLIKRTNVTTPVELTRHRANQALIIIMTTTTVSAD
ncbi:unnamed protein product [Heligmosomoides polygyrus]|uniref:HTH_7 domain-containing protein n=1 Tax=Heligmosomoides polygyrus TaxID=6339 RepID=A0A3P7X2W8_HELPZ|nr:unnamed protein product [Heligmosomoides polygyrus]